MKLSCEIVRDLLPTYVDDLVGEETAAAVEAHVALCPGCAEALRAMEQPEKRKGPEKKEVDFLKKQRRKRWLFALAGVVAALVMLVVGFGAWFVPTYLWGEELPADGYLKGELATATAAVSYTVTVEDNVVTINGVLLNGGGFARVKFEEAEGVVRAVICSAPKEDFNSTAFRASYAAKGEVERVLVGDMVAWEDGVTVGRAAAECFAAVSKEESPEKKVDRVQKYLGFDRQFLLWNEYWPDYSILLQGTIDCYDEEENELVNIPSVYTDERLELSLVAFRLTGLCTKDGNCSIEPEKKAALEARLWDMSVLLLATMPELESVQWTYMVEAENSEWPGGTYWNQGSLYHCEWYIPYEVTAEEASMALGSSVKEFGATAAGLQRLIDALEYSAPGLRQMSLATEAHDHTDLYRLEWLKKDTLYLNISCDVDVPLEQVKIRFYANRELAYEELFYNLDGTLLTEGCLARVEIQAQVSEEMKQDHIYSYYDTGYELDEAWFVVILTDETGAEYPLQSQAFSGAFGRSYYYTLRGDFETGFTLVPS